MLSQKRQRFHVVCHDCEFEALTADEEEARDLSDTHITAEDHQVRYARIE